MASATWNGQPIPGIRDVSEEDVLLADESTTAGGSLRRDVVAYRRQWTLRTAPISADEADAICQAIRASVYGVGQFWVKGLPGPVEALADPATVRWVFELPGKKQVELTIKERQGRME